MILTHSEKAVLLEALENYGIEKFNYCNEDGHEIANDEIQSLTDIGRLDDQRNLIERIKKIKSVAPKT